MSPVYYPSPPHPSRLARFKDPRPFSIVSSDESLTCQMEPQHLLLPLIPTEQELTEQVSRRGRAMPPTSEISQYGATVPSLCYSE